MVHDDPSLIWKNAVGGAISGFARTAIHTAIMGAPYYEDSYGEEGVYRKGGIACLVSDKIKIGRGITLGRHVYTYEKKYNSDNNRFLRYHENLHLKQIKEMGVAGFYGRTILEYIKYGIHGVYKEPSSLEYKADKYAEHMTGWRIIR